MHNTENVTDNEDDYHHQQHPPHHHNHNQNHQNSISTTTPAIGNNTNNNGIIKIEYNNATPQSVATTKTTTTGATTTGTISGTGLSNNNTTTIGIKGEHNVNDDNNNIARICSKCKEPIKQRYLLKALDLFWHEDCLKCDCCECRLGEVGQTLYYKSNLILCKRDYLRMFGTQGTCTACGHIIPPFELVMRAKSNVYHLECFACQQCNHRFCVGDSYYLCDGKILCVYDYEERLLFASMPCNPSNLAHIRRQVSSLQPVGDNMNNCGNLGIGNGDHRLLPLSFARQPIYSNEKFSITSHPQLSHHQQQQQQQHQHQQQQQQQQQHLQQQQQHLQQQQQHPSNIGHQHRDDGSSGYGSPDSETFETPPSQ